jgi:hypothetical protein
MTTPTLDRPTPVAPTQAFTASLALNPTRAAVGDTVAVSGAGYPPAATVDLVWHTVRGHYDLQGGTEFVGQAYEDCIGSLGSVVADAAGEIRAQIVVPLDFGGAHDVRGRVDGREISQASLTIEPTIFLMPEEGPVGTPIELHIVGVDCRPSLNTWHILYDNRYLGCATAVTTNGVAVARFRATGPVGAHIISAWNNSFNNTPYLAWSTGPFRDIPGPGTELIFATTADERAPEALVEDFASTDDPWPSLRSGPGSLSLSVDRGTPATPTTLRGGALPPDTDLTVRWWTTVGNRITAGGYEDHAEPLATILTDADGGFSIVMAIPDDLGGQHRIDLVNDHEEVAAAVGVVILPSLVSFGPRLVKAGERLRIQLKGLGWTTIDNTYTVTYDNAYIGYVCGFSTNGDIQFELTATGAPGTHLIDFYPTIYRSTDPGRMPRGVYSVPQLTYAEDHPGRRTPAIRLAFEIVA